MTSRSKNPGSAVVVAILHCVTLRQTCGAEGQRRLKPVFITCCVEHALFGPAKQGMHDAAKMMDDQHCYVQGVYSVIARGA